MSALFKEYLDSALDYSRELYSEQCTYSRGLDSFPIKAIIRAVDVDVTQGGYLVGVTRRTQFRLQKEDFNNNGLDIPRIGDTIVIDSTGESFIIDKPPELKRHQYMCIVK